MFTYRATLLRVIDGDTATLLLDTGFGGRQEEDIRLLGVSAPERTQPGGPDARTFTGLWFGRLPTRHWPVLVQTVPNTAAEPSERRTFVRYLATVRDITDPGRSLNADLAAFLAEHPEWGTGK